MFQDFTHGQFNLGNTADFICAPTFGHPLEFIPIKTEEFIAKMNTLLSSLKATEIHFGGISPKNGENFIASTFVNSHKTAYKSA
jgi:hypothetical protein